MRAKPSSPRGSRGLIVANLVVYGLLLGLVGLYRADISWGTKSFQAYRAVEGEAEFQMTADQARLSQAESALKEGRFEQAIALADESLEIEPYSKGWLLKAVASRQLGRDDDAMRFYTRYVEIDPSLVEPYLDIARIHFRRNEFDQAAEILNRGASEFRSRLTTYQPQLDATAADRENRKAIEIYESYRVSVERLESALARVEQARQIEQQ